MPQLILCILSVLVLIASEAIAVTDVSVSSGNAQATYTESTDSQSKELTGTENSLSVRNLESFSFVDLGIDLGSLKLSSDSGSHDVDFEANYLNLTAGVSLSLYPSWVEYYLDLGYRLGVGKLEVIRTQSDGSKTNYTYNDYVDDLTLRYGIKFVVFGAYLIGINYENKNGLINKSTQILNPKIDSANSVTFSIGYRFGGVESETQQSAVPDGLPNYTDPCRIFGACN